MKCIEMIASIAEIMTALVAVVTASYLWYQQCNKQRKLEDYLKNDQPKAHTFIHLMARVGLTEDEILKSSFRSKHIERLVHQDEETGLADGLLFKYR